MRLSPSQTHSWLKDEQTCRLLGNHLQVTGRVMIREVQTRHFPRPFAQLLYQALRLPHKLLALPVAHGTPVEPTDLRLWPLLTLLVTVSAAGGSPSSLTRLPPPIWRRAHVLAAAAEFLSTALDIIDDVQDGDNPFVQRIGPQAIGLGLTCLELAHLAFGQTPFADGNVAALAKIHESLLTSLSGQFLDIQFERTTTVTEEDILDMTGKKSGTLLALLCRLGALTGSSEQPGRGEDYLDTMSRFGWHLGIWRQLLNDLSDARPAQDQPMKSDRDRNKKTLPLAVEGYSMMGDKKSHQHPDEALFYTAVVAESYRVRASRLLQTLESQFGPHLLWPLVHLPDSEDESIQQA